METDFPLLREQQICNTVEEGRLARSVCPQNRENLSLLKGEAHVIKQGAFRPVGEGQMFYFQNHDSFILCFNKKGPR